MENLSKRKERRNSLILLISSVFLILAVLLLFIVSRRSSEDLFVAKIVKEEAIFREKTLLFVGDIMLSRAVGAVIKKSGDWRYPFLETAEFLKSADLTFGNLEGPISSRGTNMGSIYSFRADPKVVEGIVYAGFDVLSIANNHIWDYGKVAFTDTIGILESAGVSPVGGGDNYDKAHEPIIKVVGDTKVAYLAYTNLIPSAIASKEAVPAVVFLDLETAVLDVKSAKNISDIVVVSLHWGEEYKSAANNYQKSIGHTLIENGANLIIGHHPHVVQELEKYRNGFIAYSLGNFVFDQNFSEETMRGIVLRAIIRDKKIENIEEIEIKINDSFQPFLSD